MMKTTILLTITLLFIACASDKDKQSQLKELEQKRDDLNTQIEKLRAELAMETTSNKEIKKVVEISQINYSPFQHFIKIQGNVESDNNILIPAQASGVVKKIYVKEGQSVHKGQLLAELDGAIYESSIRELETSLELATTIFKRQERLWEKKIGSEIQYLQAKTNKESLQQKLATVKEQYRLTKVTAPIDGSVDQIMIKENEATAAGMGTIRVVKLTDLKITAKLSEVYQGSIHKGDSVDVEIPLMNKTFKSRVSAVAEVIDPNNRTFIVEISVPKSLNNLKPNMLVRLSINDYANPAALTVPLQSVQKTADASFLFVANIEKESAGNIYTAEKRFIKPGMYYENRLEIKDGLQNGEFVIITGFRDLADNEKVRLATADPKTSMN
jgi:membrane fusion protein, multidrug efflux system